MKKISGNDKGFTLVELVLATLILAVVLAGLIQVFIQCSVLTELTRNKTAAMNEALGKMEEIRNTDFDSIITGYHESWFSLTQLTGKGLIYVTSVETGLLEIEIEIGWENKYSRTVPSDLDLDSIVDTSIPSSDVDINSKVLSPVTLVSRITDRL